MGRMNLLSKLLDKFCQKPSVVIEIGVHHADTTTYLLDNCQITHLYGIDPYINRDEAYERTKNKLSKYDNCTLLRKTSNEAINLVPDKVDLVFIDGSHVYDDVLADLNNYVPKVKSNGIISGHDWCKYKLDVVLAGTKYFSYKEELFKPLYTNEELEQLGLNSIQAGLSVHPDNKDSRVVHKDKTSRYPVWWRIKK